MTRPGLPGRPADPGGMEPHGARLLEPGAGFVVNGRRKRRGPRTLLAPSSRARPFENAFTLPPACGSWRAKLGRMSVAWPAGAAVVRHGGAPCGRCTLLHKAGAREWAGTVPAFHLMEVRGPHLWPESRIEEGARPVFVRLAGWRPGWPGRRLSSAGHVLLARFLHEGVEGPLPAHGDGCNA